MGRTVFLLLGVEAVRSGLGLPNKAKARRGQHTWTPKWAQKKGRAQPCPEGHLFLAFLICEPIQFCNLLHQPEWALGYLQPKAAIQELKIGMFSMCFFLSPMSEAKPWIPKASTQLGSPHVPDATWHPATPSFLLTLGRVRKNIKTHSQKEQKRV